MCYIWEEPGNKTVKGNVDSGDSGHEGSEGNKDSVRNGVMSYSYDILARNLA